MEKLIGFSPKYNEDEWTEIPYWNQREIMEELKSQVIMDAVIDLSSYGFKTIRFNPRFAHPYNGCLEYFYSHDHPMGEIHAYAQSDKKAFDRFYAMQLQISGNFSNPDQLMMIAKTMVKLEKKINSLAEEIYGDRVSDITLPVYIAILFKAFKLKGMVLNGVFFDNSKDAINAICDAIGYKSN